MIERKTIQILEVAHVYLSGFPAEAVRRCAAQNLPEPRFHQDFLAQFRDEEVNRALLALPEEYRLPLVLFYVEELSYRELAEVLECPMGTVMSRLFRGRKIIERELWEYAKQKGLIKRWKP
jgi:RNA polymerase sigma factor (sigma-70 family)